MPSVFINELHYDNSGSDTGEFIEIAGPAGTDLTGWRLVLYNGSNNQVYSTTNLSGVIDDEGSGYGAIAFSYPANGIQNGSPDGIALVDNNDVVVQFLSYEGEMTAVDGPAAGMTSTDIGVSEPGSDPVGNSLQLTGDGLDSGDFTWTAPSAESPGSLNAGQTFGGVALPGEVSIQDVTMAEGDVGPTQFTFVIERTGGSAGEVSVDYVVTLDSADAGDVSGALSGTVVFADGQTSAVVTVNVTGDQVIEGDESFTVTLSNPQGGIVIADGEASGTILDDDTPMVESASVFINEIHYDNNGGDTGEGVEIAGLAGTDLNGWSIVLYNGNGGASYATYDLSGTIDNEGSGYGAVSVATPGIQNGAPDGIALVDAGGNVVQFLSYEGTITATNGPAAGMESTDIGVFESGSGPIGASLQLVGDGSGYGDFDWIVDAPESFGSLNQGQTFVPANPNGSFAISDGIVLEGDDGTTTMTFTVSRSGGTQGEVSVAYDVNFLTGFGAADASDLASTPSGVITLADGQAYTQFTVEIAGDTIGEPTETFEIVLSGATGGADIADAVGIGTILPDDPVAIGLIQGESHTSSFDGQAVATQGIVTALAYNGFYLQDFGDGNVNTSDAIFVFTGGAPSVAVGDDVTVTGTVEEYRPGGNSTNLTTTEITSPIITINSSGNALPAAVVIGPDGITPPTEVIDDDFMASYDPATDGIDFYESLEGMLVTVQAPVVQQGTNGNGEVWVVASDGEGTLDATNVSEDGLVVINGEAAYPGYTNSNGASDFNPERIQIDDGLVGPTLDLSVGDQLADVTGVISYNFGNYELLNVAPIAVDVESTIIPETSDLTGATNQLTIATYNALNLDPTDGEAKFDAIAYDIGVAMNAPDIVVLEEIQDNDGAANSGTVSASLTLQMLVDSIYEQTGVQYSYLDNTSITDGTNGGEPGGNIRVAFLYREDRVDLDEASVTAISDPAFDGSRTPLAADFHFNGETVTVIGAHLTSKGGSTQLFGALQPPINGGEYARIAQAAAINAYVAGLLAGQADANVVVAGDLNDFQFEESTLVLGGQLDYDGFSVVEADGPAELFNTTWNLPANERYSYIFEGNAQQIDHVLVSQNLIGGADIDAVHVNTAQDDAASDHDPVLVRLDVGYNVQDGGDGKDLLVGNDGMDKLFGGNGDDALYGLGGDDILDGGKGNDILDGGLGDDFLSGGQGDDILIGGEGHDVLTGGKGDDIFVLDADGGDGDGDVITDFGAKASGNDTLYIENADGHQIEFTQQGADTLVTSDGVVIATVIGANSDAVALATSYDGTPAEGAASLMGYIESPAEIDLSSIFGSGLDAISWKFGGDVDAGLHHAGGEDMAAMMAALAL